MAQMCLGLSGGFGPTIRPWFHETRVFVSLMISTRPAETALRDDGRRVDLMGLRLA